MTISHLNYLIIFLCTTLFLLSTRTTPFWKDIIMWFSNLLAFGLIGLACAEKYGWQGWLYPPITIITIYLALRYILIYPLLNLTFWINDLIKDHKQNFTKKDL